VEVMLDEVSTLWFQVNDDVFVHKDHCVVGYEVEWLSVEFHCFENKI
jgi:hypothetical protein